MRQAAFWPYAFGVTSDITAAYPQLVVDAVCNPPESFTYDYDGNMTQDDRSSMTDGTGSINLKSAMWNLKYDPFGILTAEQVSLAVSNSFRFSSKYWDEDTELAYYGYRYYSSGMGKWLSRDPIQDIGFVLSHPVQRFLAGLEDGDDIVARDAFGEYVFVVNAPTDVIDLLGLCKCGMEVGEKLKDVLNNLTKTLEEDANTRKWVCKEAFFNLVDGWDINPLNNDPAQLVLARESCGQGPCAGTVSVNGRCYKTDEVNYVLWGALNRICGRNIETAEDLARAWRIVAADANNKPMGIAGRLTWTRLGYAGRLTYKQPTRVPSSIEPEAEIRRSRGIEDNQASEMTDRCPTCPASYAGKLQIMLNGKSGHTLTVESF